MSKCCSVRMVQRNAETDTEETGTISTGTLFGQSSGRHTACKS